MTEEAFVSRVADSLSWRTFLHVLIGPVAECTIQAKLIERVALITQLLSRSGAGGAVVDNTLRAASLAVGSLANGAHASSPFTV